MMNKERGSALQPIRRFTSNTARSRIGEIQLLSLGGGHLQTFHTLLFQSPAKTSPLARWPPVKARWIQKTLKPTAMHGRKSSGGVSNQSAWHLLGQASALSSLMSSRSLRLFLHPRPATRCAFSIP